jgi:hypothetical protein
MIVPKRVDRINEAAKSDHSFGTGINLYVHLRSCGELDHARGRALCVRRWTLGLWLQSGSVSNSARAWDAYGGSYARVSLGHGRN